MKNGHEIEKSRELLNIVTRINYSQRERERVERELLNSYSRMIYSDRERERLEEERIILSI